MPATCTVRRVTSQLALSEKHAQELLTALASPSGDAASAAEHLAALTRRPANREAAAEAAGWAPALVRALRSADGEVQRHAATALQNMAVEPAAAADILGAGGVSACLGLLKTAREPHVLAAAAGTLANLASDSKPCRQIAAGTGQLVMLLSHESALVRDAAASVVAQLAWEESLCKGIADAGALKPLLGLLAHEDSDNLVHQTVAVALQNLTYESNAIRRAVVDLGGVPLLVQLLESPLEAAQKSAAAALNNLACVRNNCETIAAAGAIEPLVDLLEHGSDAVMATAGSTIGKLALLDSNRSEIAEARQKLLTESDDSN